MNTEEIQTGTTIMAFKFREGIVVAADSRTSSGTFIASRVTDKLDLIMPNIFCCRSGSAADTQMILRTVQREIKIMTEMDGTVPSVEKAARLVSSIIYENNEHLTAAMIIAGYDTEPRIYKVNVCGSLIEGDILIGGSGSAYIYGFCDTHFTKDMGFEEAVAFAKSAVKLAIKRDNSSGGVIRIATVTKEGVSRYFVPGDRVMC